ncbi:MAG: ATP phosphoribosyltransferase regulatory subunit, partial [Oscillospiraceae bacterium]|nr:ATP phosphoribosyltransferase regulatory subunit [Oscillospiraceae bacterium]
PKNSGRDDEFTQSGIEILGGESGAADYEALSLAAKALAVCDEDYRLEIGDNGFFRELISQLGADEEQAESIREFIETKNYPALGEILSGYDNNAAAAIGKLPELFGGREVFAEAEKYMFTDPPLKARLNELKALYDGICDICPADRIRVDLGLVHKKNYYTGILFRGYVEGYGRPVLSGGRYDKLLGDFGREAAAIGFAVNVEAAAKVLYARGVGVSAPDVLVHAESGAQAAALRHCAELISKGLTVYHSLFECPKCAAEYAKAHNIRRVDIVSADGSVETKEV